MDNTRPDYTKLTLDQLVDAKDVLARTLEMAKAEATEIDKAINDRVKAPIDSAILASGKDYGTFNVPLGGGFTVKAEIKKVVKYDSAALLDIAKTMDFARAQQIFKIDFSLSEKLYDGLKIADPVLTAKIDKARTVTFSKTGVSIIRDEVAA